MDFEVLDPLSLKDAAKTLLELDKEERIFLFYGDMGAGKTTFIKKICEFLQVEDTTSSPTFSIVNEYIYPQGKIYHFDFYRLKNETEALDIGYEDYLYSGEYCFIEWPEKIRNLLPRKYIEVSIQEMGKLSRRISMKTIIS